MWSSIKKSLLHLVYPTKCLHCQLLIPPETQVLCLRCAALLEMIDPLDRCPSCFSPLSENEPSICQKCVQNPSEYLKIGAAFNYEGPAASLVKRLKYGNQPYLAQGMAAFLVMQFDRLAWPIPDALVPVPLSFTHRLERGYNQSALLAEEMGKLLNCTIWDVLKRQSGDYSQAALSLEQRKALEKSRFRLKSKYILENKKLLVIDDVMTSGSTLQRCAETLQIAKPAALYALTFCQTFLNF